MNKKMKSLKGLFLHLLDDNFEINYQCHVLQDFGKSIEVQLFSYLTGYPTEISTIEKPSPKYIRIYKSIELMKFYYDLVGDYEA